MKKILIAVVSTVLICCCVFGGTLAWLMDTKSITNTFTFGDINITLDESALNADGKTLSSTRTTSPQNYKVVPGVVYPKDPIITVKANSENCWLFVKIEAPIADVLEYSIADGWEKLDTVPGVYFRSVSAKTIDQPFNVLADNEITINDELTKGVIENLKDPAPTLVLTAYAVQAEGVETEAAAWAIANPNP